jgi:hypothetical protein
MHSVVHIVVMLIVYIPTVLILAVFILSVLILSAVTSDIFNKVYLTFFYVIFKR